MIKVGEYMAMGKPVVAYALPESRLTANGTALFAASGDIVQFAGCIEALLDDESLRLALGERARTRIQKQLSWERSEEMLLKAYSSGLSK
jgi:glycosyltransferase involved in cell wall biosynthesis